MISVDAVGYEDSELENQAKVYADILNLPLKQYSDNCLFVGKDQLALKLKQFIPLSADFSISTWKKRQAEGKKQGIVRACKPQPGLKIVDATAGWGRDAAILASFGAEVLMLERHPIMGLLLNDALNRRTELDRQALNLSILTIDALTYFQSLSEQDYPEVIYIDPMHPERTKAALVKKDMQVLQQMIGPDLDVLTLIETARRCVKQRVVVKWPQKREALLPSNARVEGKTVRFDLYFPV